jgi:hypothetical protein
MNNYEALAEEMEGNLKRDSVFSFAPVPKEN